MRSIRTGFPARASSYRPTSSMNVPICTLSEGIIRTANLRHFTASRGFLFAVSTGNLQALSIVCWMSGWQHASSNPGEAEGHPQTLEAT